MKQLIIHLTNDFQIRDKKYRLEIRKKKDIDFNLENYFTPIVSEFKALGRDVVISKKEKKKQTDELKEMLKNKIRNTNIEMVKNDVRPFIKNPSEMEIWSTDYFLQLVNMINL